MQVYIMDNDEKEGNYWKLELLQRPVYSNDKQITLMVKAFEGLPIIKEWVGQIGINDSNGNFIFNDNQLYTKKLLIIKDKDNSRMFGGVLPNCNFNPNLGILNFILTYEEEILKPK